MTPDEFLQKQRLRYLRERYFPELTIAYLSRRIRDECLPHEKERIRRNAILTIDTTYHGGDRAVRTFLEADGPSPPGRAVRSACEVFAAEFLSERGRRDDSLAIADALQRYVRFGEGGPFRIFNGHSFPFNELAFENLAPLITEPHGVAEFGALQRLRPHEAARTFLRGGPPRDWPVLHHVAIARPIEGELVGALQEGAHLVLLIGAAGDGKTTLLKRTGMILRQDNWRVFLAEALSREPFPPLPDFEATEELKTCILIDNADMAAGYPNLENDLLAQPNVYVVLCARAYLWLRKGMSFDRSTNLTIPRITPNEANHLASRIVEFNAADQPASVEALSEAINSSITGEHPHLLAAMMTATRGAGFISIIDGMIRNFEDAEEDWALRAVACGALLDDLAGNELGRLPHRVLQQLIADRLEGLVPVHSLRDRANQKLRSFASEIVPLRVTDRRNATEYDLRHPDITSRVLRHFYGLRWGETVERVETLADDLCRVADAELKTEMPGRRGETLRAALYSETAGKALVSLHPGRYAWLPPLLGREFVRYLLSQYGNYEREIGRRGDLLWQWAAAESHREQPETSKIDSRRWSDDLFEEAVQLNPQLETAWVQWTLAALRRGDIGDRAAPGKYSSRWIFRHAWEEGVREVQLLVHWLRLEAEQENIGSVESPEPFTARWIARHGWSAGIQDANLLQHWMQLETGQGNVGDARSPGPFTTRSIAREAWSAGIRDPHFVEHCLRLEIERENIGDFGSPEPFTARWIARESWSAGTRNASILRRWIDLEGNRENLGEADAPSPFTVRWLMRQAWAAGIREGALLIGWLTLEVVHQNIGEFVSPKSFTARWIARQAWTVGVRDASFLMHWMELEGYKGILGEFTSPKPFTARWIVRQGWSMGLCNYKPLLNRWGRLEANRGYLGDLDKPAPFSARWVLRQLIEDQSPSYLPLIWLEYTNSNGVIGDFEHPAPWSGRQLARQFWESPRLANWSARVLASLELTHGGMSPTDQRPYTPLWYFQESRDRFLVEEYDLATWIAAAPAWAIRNEENTEGFGDTTNSADGVAEECNDPDLQGAVMDTVGRRVIESSF